MLLKALREQLAYKEQMQMKRAINFEQLRKVGVALIAFGVMAALFGKVRTGSLLLSLGLGGFSYARYFIVGMKRRIELFLPLIIAGTLFVVSLTLPHAG
jgi:hypothetical protein